MKNQYNFFPKQVKGQKYILPLWCLINCHEKCTQKYVRGREGLRKQHLQQQTDTGSVQSENIKWGRESVSSMVSLGNLLNAIVLILC